jgi:hypothetical protein
MLTKFHDILGTNIDYGTPNRFGAIDGQVKILNHFKAAQFWFEVDHTLIDGIGDGVVDQEAKRFAISKLLKHIIQIQREGIAQLWMAAKGLVDVSAIRLSLFSRVRVSRSVRR